MACASVIFTSSIRQKRQHLKKRRCNINSYPFSSTNIEHQPPRETGTLPSSSSEWSLQRDSRIMLTLGRFNTILASSFIYLLEGGAINLNTRPKKPLSDCVESENEASLPIVLVTRISISSSSRSQSLKFSSQSSFHFEIEPSFVVAALDPCPDVKYTIVEEYLDQFA
ncbi:hypothetical protein K1719_010082 [Acacia pycnantha]|nr:hypothetical protein K1719_010082 [Acacia pycnantha]